MKQKQTTPAEETEDKRPNETPDGDSSDGESSDGESSDGLKEAGESMLSHLMALRKVLLISAAAVLIGFVLVFYLAIDPLMAQILAPIQARGIQVIFTTMSEALVTKFKVALLAGVIIASPVVIWEIWGFIKPALYPQEKRKFRLLFVLALLLCALITTLCTHLNPLKVFGTMFGGAFGSSRKIWILGQNLAVLLCISLAVTPAFKMRFWNIGAEGQITAGAIAASYFALYWVGKVPSAVLLLIMGAAGAVAGGIWALIPAFFKARWNTNETLFTLMMNYIIIGVVRWLQGGPWEGRPGSQIIPMFDQSAWLPEVFGVHCGWIIVLVLVVVMHLYMNYTKHGYEIAVIGDSLNTARYAGMNVGHVMMRTMFLSGAISGLVGFIVASGANNTLYDGVANGVGFTSITVAWLSQLNAFAMIVISALLAILEKGAETLQTAMQVPTSISDIVTGILLFCMLGCEFFINYRMIFRRKQAEAPAAPAAAESDQTVSKEDASC